MYCTVHNFDLIDERPDEKELTFFTYCIRILCTLNLLDESPNEEYCFSADNSDENSKFLGRDLFCQVIRSIYT